MGRAEESYYRSRMVADLWTTEQKAGKDASRACGVRVDVPQPPAWMRACLNTFPAPELCTLQEKLLRDCQTYVLLLHALHISQSLLYSSQSCKVRIQLCSRSRQRIGIILNAPLGRPACMQEGVMRPMEEAKLVPEAFLDSCALNIYHDGSQGIQPHYDDSTRFERPVYSLRLFSDSRLSFGTQLYGYTNGAFCVDMPRGAITIMHAGGYAVAGAKHCVRPVDLAGGLLPCKLSQAISPCTHRQADSTCECCTACIALQAEVSAGC